MEEILISYIEDLRESIVTFNEALMNVQGGSRDADDVNNIFRVAHTIKGNSAAMGFMKIQGVMHIMEDLLAEVRNNTREFTDELVEVLFACHDFLEDSLEAVERDSSDAGMDPDSLTARLSGLKTGGAAPKEAAAPPAAAAAGPLTGDFDLNINMPADLWEILYKNIQGGGYNVYKLDIKFMKNSSMKAVRAWMIFDRIEQSAIIVHSEPPRISESSFGTAGETAFDAETITAVIMCETEISELVSDLKEIADIESVETLKIANEDIQNKIVYINKQKKIIDRMQEISVELLGVEMQFITDEIVKNIIERMNELRAANIGGASSPISVIANRLSIAFEEALTNKKRVSIRERENIIFLCQTLEECINSPHNLKDDNLVSVMYNKLEEIIEVVTAPEQRVGDILTAGGYISSHEADTIAAKQKDENLKFGQVAVKEKLVSPLDVVTALATDKEKPGTAAKSDSGFVRISTDKVDTLIDLLSELLIYNSQLSQSTSLTELEDSKTANILSRTEKLIKEIQELSMSLRMIEVRQTFNRLTRVARDTAADLGKKISVNLEGVDMEMDRSAIEKLFEPLMHMVRNSVDHGIEKSEEDRIAVGKKPEGQVTIAGYSKQGSVYIEVRDDGRGIDLKRVYEKAKQKGMINENREYSPQEIYKFIFKPGFSTQDDNVSAVSGRGVGMNVVEEIVTKLGGKIEIDSEFGVGSSFKIKLPQNLAVIDGTIVNISGNKYIIPTICVKKFFMAKHTDWVSLQGENRAIKLTDGSIVSMISKQRIFGIPDDEIEPNDENEYDMILLEADQKMLVLRVDKILSRQDVVSKPLMSDYASVAYANSASILGDGIVSLILDIDAIFKMSQPN
ncbi:MAG: chemotaxis protein CheA [Oscillospiraceae bacterium]|nr:chemotaxis protein CheA [Oscillospiraceae bacterium]